MFIHIDIDSFFASAERSVNHNLKNIAIAVGTRSNLEIFNKKRTNIQLINNNSGAFVAPVFYSSNNKSFESVFIDEIDGKKKIRGIITTSSYEARAFGVKTAMPISHALQLCPKLIVVPSNYPLYHKLSYKMHLFIQQYIPKVEQYSIDEFFGDLSGWIEDKDVYNFAKTIQSNILKEFDIPVSIGISKAKWIAKLATESAKPYGVFEVKNIDNYIEHIPIKEFPGIGKSFQSRLQKYYILTLGDVKKHKKLFYSWKKPGIQLYNRVTGEDNEAIMDKGERKSIGISRTFDPIYNKNEIERRIMIMARHISYIVFSIEANPTSYYLKINYEYGIKVKGTKTINRVFSEQLFKRTLKKMYKEIYQSKKGAIKLSINVSNFSNQNNKTLSLIDLKSDTIEYNLSLKIQQLRESFGLDIIKTANEL